MRALIGHTGFVGSNILRQTKFDKCYNSKNIESIAGKEFDVVVCAGVSSIKWKANQNPSGDFINIQRLMDNLSRATFNKFILISTIAVYNTPADNVYGRHRLYLETFVENKFKDCLIIRLPSIFGVGMKKNPIYDLLNKDYRFLPNPESKFQYYCLDNIWSDIEVGIKNNIKYLNICTEPIKFSTILEIFGLNMVVLNKSITQENMKTVHAKYWNKSGVYIYGKKEVLEDLKRFTAAYE